MTTNADITVYNRLYDPLVKLYRYRRTVIKGVWWHSDNRAAIQAGGVQAADLYKVRIPAHADFGGAEYVPPWAYTGADDTWTLQADDYICRGAMDTEIEKPADLLKQSGRQVFKVTGWADNRFGGLPHWRIEGV